jgi:ribosomal subunit interface protein
MAPVWRHFLWSLALGIVTQPFHSASGLRQGEVNADGNAPGRPAGLQRTDKIIQRLTCSAGSINDSRTTQQIDARKSDRAKVILTVEKLNQIAEAKLNVNGGEIFANSQQADMYAAIDTLIDKLDRQIIKHKEKLNSK